MLKLARAYETISDPEKRKAYDTQWVHIRNSQRTQQEAEKRQAEVADTERRRAAKEKANKQKQENARQERLQHLELLRSGYYSDIFEVNRVVRRLEADLKIIQKQDNEELRKEREINSWWAYLTSPIYGKQEETEQKRQERETERLQRLASRLIKENDLFQRRAKLQGLRDALQDVTSKIAAEKKEKEDEERMEAAKRQEQLRKEQEARRRVEKEEIRKSWARWEELQAELRKEQAARAAKEAREAQEAWEALERLRKAADERRKAEAEERARAARAAEAAQKAKETRNDRFQPATPLHSYSRASMSNKSTCRHHKYWPKLEGSHLCSTCQNIQRRFAFQCPGCSMIACASCRQILKGKGR